MRPLASSLLRRLGDDDDLDAAFCFFDECLDVGGDSLFDDIGIHAGSGFIERRDDGGWIGSAKLGHPFVTIIGGLVIGRHDHERTEPKIEIFLDRDALPDDVFEIVVFDR